MMANEEYVIDVTVNANDHMSETLAQSQQHVTQYERGLEQLSEAARQTASELVRTQQYVSQFDQSLLTMGTVQQHTVQELSRVTEYFNKLDDAVRQAQQDIIKLNQTEVAPKLNDSLFLSEAELRNMVNLSSVKTASGGTVNASQLTASQLRTLYAKQTGQNILLAPTQPSAPSKWDTTIGALDKASSVINSVTSKGMEFSHRTFETVLRAKDLATAPIRGVMNMMTSYQAYMLGAMAVGVGAAAIAWPLKLADNLQQAQIAFTTMLGSARKAQQFMTQVQNFAIATPFSTADIVKNAQFMMALGFSAQQVIPTLTAVGDAASAMGGSADTIQRILLALGQMQAHGKVDAQDMLQLTSANIPAWQILADKMHLSVAQVQKLAQAGKMDAAPAVQAIIAGMEKLYGGQMQKNANATFSGLMSQITDTFKIDVVTKWGQGLEHSILPALAKLNDWLGRNQQTINQWGMALQQAGAQGAQWVVEKVTELAQSLDTLVNSAAWQNAPTFWDKMKVGWQDLVVVPFDSWWSGSGQQEVASIAGQVGGFFGSALHGMIMAAFGLATPSASTHTVSVDMTPGKIPSLYKHLDPADQQLYLQSFQKTVTMQGNTFADAGQTAGTAFFNAFAKAFNADELANKAIQAFKGAQPTFLGGNTHSWLGDSLVLGGEAYLLSKLWKSPVGGAVRWTGGKIFGGGGSEASTAADVAASTAAKNPSLWSRISSWIGGDTFAAGLTDAVPASLLALLTQKSVMEPLIKADANPAPNTGNNTYDYLSSIRGLGWLANLLGSKTLESTNKPAASSATKTASTTSVSVNLGGVTMPVTVTSGDPNQVLQIIRDNLQKIADEVMYEMGTQMARAHANMPVMTPG